MKAEPVQQALSPLCWVFSVVPAGTCGGIFFCRARRLLASKASCLVIRALSGPSWKQRSFELQGSLG